MSTPTQPASTAPEPTALAPRRRRGFLMTTAGLSAAVAVAIVGFLVVRDPTPHVSREGTLSVAPPSTTRAPEAPVATYPTTPPATLTSAAVPASVTIPAIGVGAPVDPVGLAPGTNQIEIPPITRVGWYRFGPAPGDAGSAVLLGHVDGNGKEGVFFRLGSLQPGDPVQVGFTDGTTRGFHIVGRAEYPKSALPADFFTRAGPTRLVLITCGGSFDASIRHYRDNVVVVAEPDA